jgi:hypothetical protein
LSGFIGPEYLGGEHLTIVNGQGTVFFQPMEVGAAFGHDRFVILNNFSAASNSSNSASISIYVGLYTRDSNSLKLSSSSSSSWGVTLSGTAGSYSWWAGKKLYPIGWTSTVTAGNYWLGIMSRTTTGGGAGMSWSNYAISNQNTALSGVFGTANNASDQFLLGLGSYSVTTSAMPGTVAFSEMRGSAAGNIRPIVYAFLATSY